jgi:hypothetical protein
MLEFFAHDGHWTRGSYDDGNGGHCLVGALLHLSRKHRLPTAPAIALLQDAVPRPGLPLVHFNDTRCGSVTELRSVIVKARQLARDDAARERATAAVKTWLLAQIEQKRAAPASDIVETASGEPRSSPNDSPPRERAPSSPQGFFADVGTRSCPLTRVYPRKASTAVTDVQNGSGQIPRRTRWFSG